MAALILLVILVVVVAAWIHIHNRLYQIESRLRALEWQREQERMTVARAEPQPVEVRPAPAAPAAAPPAVPAFVTPEPTAYEPPPEELPPPLEPSPVAAPAAPRAPVDWETVLGGNWLNKLGVFIFVIGLALALGYSFTQFGPAGRVAIGLAASVAMLAAGAWFEPREQYRTFARGLLGGGWAALYTTVYAMQAIPAAQVLHNAVVGAVLLLAVSAGMIGHSLRYRSQTVTGVAYFVAFGTLAITQVTWFSVVAMLPLVASLLYVAWRLEWRQIAVFGVAATWAVMVLRGDAGAPLWQAQAVFALFWLLFESFDLLRPDAFLLPLNAAGALGLSLYKWQSAAPAHVWWFFAGAAAAYLASALLRAWRGQRWAAAATLTAGLAAAAIFLRLHHQWIALGLLVEAEIVYLTGVRLRAWYLRVLGTALAALHLLYLLIAGVGTLPLDAWVPVASVDAAVFYANRALWAADFFWGFAGAGMLALIAGYEFAEPLWGRVWIALGAAAFAVGWSRRLLDFRLQGYALAILGATATAFYAPHPPLGLALGAVAAYAAVQCAMRSGPDRFRSGERNALRVAASVGFTLSLVGLAWKLAPADYRGVAWLALALALLELGQRGLPDELVWQAYAVAAIGVLQVLFANVLRLPATGPLEPRWIPAEAAVLAYAFAWRSRIAPASAAGTFFLADALWALLPAGWVAPAWGALAMGLLTAPRDWESWVMAALAFGRCAAVSFQAPDWQVTGPLTIACLYGAQFWSTRGSRPRLYYSLLGTVLGAALIWDRVSGEVLTVAWGLEGVVLLAAGFPLRDRVMRLSGLALLFGCILKLFLWDLRELETLPRIISFLVLGLILVGVSWIYTRFRERVERLL